MWDDVKQKQQDIARVFVADLEAYLNLKAAGSSFQDHWQAATRKEAGASSLNQYINKDHMHKFGHPPYLSAPNVELWDCLSGISHSDYTKAVYCTDVYRKRFWHEYFDNRN
ncbi:hypothetical protein GQ44DRAFT_773451 [Phaeosphaeriaceae sp. PMI808]|nr:hypothetical protein GQ44DRAFT_773451 [Phaeosphaeriaceae sp. PMI808]